MRKLRIIVLVMLLFILSSCGGAENIQELTYVVAIGVDYDEEAKQYLIYTMALDFSGVAKQEGQKQSQSVPIWIGKAKGHTVSEAISGLQKSTQPKLYLKHVKTFLFSEKVLQTKLSDVLGDIGRLDFFRQSDYLFGTDSSIEDIFSTRALFDFPPNYSILLKPLGEETENYLKHIPYREFISRFYEPVGASYIPAIGVKKSWEKNRSKYPGLTIKGAYFYEDQGFTGYKSIRSIKGIRWSEKEEMENTYTLGDKEKPHTVVKITTSDLKVKVRKNKDKPVFDLFIKGEADILESLQKVSESKIQEDLEKTIKEEIDGTFKEGLAIKTDVLRIGTKWFRNNKNEYLAFRERHQLEPFYLDENSIRNIRVKVKLHSTYNYKLKTRTNIWDMKSIYMRD
ncbi:Ger(x)C family spore germination C-terminal domain-containing protein [Pseudalkalibacillus caeni]|nr:Ger(x)C family spore germination C-terminal domain-containing protein [Pseudalkalibacillus caeni]